MYDNKGYGQKRTIQVSDRDGNRAPRNNGGGGMRKPAMPKGHDAVLKALQDDGREITITLQSGDKINGKVVARDKFTISVRQANGVGGYHTHIVYKHAIESFWAEDKAQVTE